MSRRPLYFAVSGAILAVAVAAHAAEPTYTGGSGTITAEVNDVFALEATGSAALTDIQFNANITRVVDSVTTTVTRTCGITEGQRFACAGVGSVAMHPVGGATGVLAARINGIAPGVTMIQFAGSFSLAGGGGGLGWHVTCEATAADHEYCDTMCAEYEDPETSEHPYWGGAMDADWVTVDSDPYDILFCHKDCACFPFIEL